MFKIFSYIVGSFFGIGHIKYAPGTFASIACALLWYSIPQEVFYNVFENEVYYDSYIYLFIGLVLFTLFSVKISTICEERFGHDHKSIVIDEVVGYLFSVIFLPKTLMIAVYALILFRIFDIGKPMFIHRIQRLPKGWGVVCDDVLAGIYVNIIIQILYRVKPNIFI